MQQIKIAVPVIVPIGVLLYHYISQIMRNTTTLKLLHSTIHTTHSSISTTQILKLPLSSLQCGALLQSLTQSKSLKQGKILHAHIITSGILIQNTYLSTKLAAFYVNCGLMQKSQFIFDHIILKNSFLWNFMIRGYTNCGFPFNALFLYCQMISRGVHSDNFTYPFVIKACSDSLSVEFGRIVHGNVVISGFECNVYVGNCLLEMYFRFQDIEKARLVFDKMSKRDLTSWNTMINGFVKNGYSSEALRFFRVMKASLLGFDCTTLLAVIAACTDVQMVEIGKEIHGYILRNNMFDSNRFLINSLLELYCKLEIMEYAWRLFSISSKDVVTWNSMISGCVGVGNGFEGLRVFCEMVSCGEQPDLATIIVVLGGCEQVAANNFGMSVHCYIIRKGFSSSIMAATSLIGMYAQFGMLSFALSVFGEVADKNLVSWTAMISAYGRHGKGREAISIFNQMVEVGIVPDEGAFTAILTACSHAGFVDDGREIFKQMQQKYNMKPVLAHYACLVDLLSRAGYLEEAYGIIKNMAVEPTVDVWVSLLCGCRLHGNVSLAEVCAQKAFEGNPDRVSAYISLSHTYANERRWNDVEKLRGIAQSKRVAMPRGYSLIE